MIKSLIMVTIMVLLATINVSCAVLPGWHPYDAHTGHHSSGHHSRGHHRSRHLTTESRRHHRSQGRTTRERH